MLIIRLFVPSFNLMKITNFLVIMTNLFLGGRHVLRDMLSMDLTVVVSNITASILLGGNCGFLPSHDGLVLSASLGQRHKCSSDGSCSRFLKVVKATAAALQPTKGITVKNIILSMIDSKGVVFRKGRVQIVRIRKIGVAIGRLSRR